MERVFQRGLDILPVTRENSGLVVEVVGRGLRERERVLEEAKISYLK